VPVARGRINTKKAQRRKDQPAANFLGLNGSRVPSATHSYAKTGANKIMKSELRDCNQLAGNR